jgi:hypothetical protein
VLFAADMVGDLVILELKHLKDDFHPTHYTQIINYLKHWDKRLGLLINFGQERLRYKRIPFSSSDVTVESIGGWDILPEATRMAVLTAVENILSKIGDGYGVDVFKKLLMAELRFNEFDASTSLLSPAFDGLRFEEREVDVLSVGSDLMILVSVSASATDLCYLKTYMKQTNRLYGVLVSLNKSNIQLRGIQ